MNKFLTGILKKVTGIVTLMYAGGQDQQRAENRNFRRRQQINE